jgi:response regulator RpfG family c-di-GMP phosphodiesterase
VLVTDSCHNKSIYKSLNTWDSQQKSLESEKSFEIFERNKHFYENVLLQLKQYPKKTCKASIITISACQDNDTTNTGNPLSEFTRNLSEVWNNSIFNGTYESFIEEIATKPSHGIPQISFSGLKNQNFKNEKPFVI